MDTLKMQSLKCIFNEQGSLTDIFSSAVILMLNDLSHALIGHYLLQEGFFGAQAL